MYDLELFPYALGDVLTWNVQTAIRCEESGRARADIFVCLDERRPAFFFQRDYISGDNSGLFLDELFGAFGTHPRLGRIFLYRRREDLLEKLRAASEGDAANFEVLAEYQRALAASVYTSDVKTEYFTQHIHSQKRMNAFAARHGRIPLLRSSVGCERDIAALVSGRFRGKRIVAVHMRLRRLDAGYGANQDEARDSHFLEWHEFLRAAAVRYPDVQFVLLGRLQEKPLGQLDMPNAISLRSLGLGLGHELTLILRSQLFIGTSSGFAAMANFSAIPYFITRMNERSCVAYGIPPGCDRLPFAAERQILVYEPETSELLMRLLERGLHASPLRAAARDVAAL